MESSLASNSPSGQGDSLLPPCEFSELQAQGTSLGL